VVGGYYAVTKLPAYLQEKRLSERLEEVTAIEAPKDENPADLVKSRHEGPLPVLDRMVSGTARGSALGAWVDQSGVQISLSALLLIGLLLAGLFGFIAASLLRMAVGWLIGAIVGFVLPFAFLRMKRTKRLRKFEETFPEALDLVARALKAGHAFASGLKMVADEMEEPVGPEFRKTFDEQNFGLRSRTR
jgi:Flp pilus assembly protein TadB